MTNRDVVDFDIQAKCSMKCYLAKAGELAKHWYIIDAEGMVVGRLAVHDCADPHGKHRPTYTPHIDTGDYVIVTNVDKVVFTGNKWRQKSYQRYSGYPGGQKEEAAWKLFERRPERILELAIQRMMPKNKIGRHMMAKLKLCVGPNHHIRPSNRSRRGTLGPARSLRCRLRIGPEGKWEPHQRQALRIGIGFADRAGPARSADRAGPARSAGRIGPASSDRTGRGACRHGNHSGRDLSRVEPSLSPIAGARTVPSGSGPPRERTSSYIRKDPSS